MVSVRILFPPLGIATCPCQPLFIRVACNVSQTAAKQAGDPAPGAMWPMIGHAGTLDQRATHALIKSPVRASYSRPTLKSRKGHPEACRA